MENNQIEDLRQSKEYGKYMAKIGWIVEDGVFVKKLGPVAIAKIQRTNKIEWKVLKKYRVFMTKLEPLEKYTQDRFKQDNWPLLATKTLRVDLRPNEAEIFSSFNKDCRYCLRKFKDEARKLNNFFEFYEIYKRSAKRKGLWIPSVKKFNDLIECFCKKCFCITINGQAGCLILMHKGVAYYYYAGAVNKSDLPYLVVWEAMKEAKKRGAEIWDFEGIYDKRWPNKGWIGFSHFKKSFGGEEVEFPSSFTRWF